MLNYNGGKSKSNSQRGGGAAKAARKPAPGDYQVLYTRSNEKKRAPSFCSAGAAAPSLALDSYTTSAISPLFFYNVSFSILRSHLE